MIMKSNLQRKLLLVTVCCLVLFTIINLIMLAKPRSNAETDSYFSSLEVTVVGRLQRSLETTAVSPYFLNQINDLEDKFKGFTLKGIYLQAATQFDYANLLGRCLQVSGKIPYQWRVPEFIAEQQGFTFLEVTAITESNKCN